MSLQDDLVNHFKDLPFFSPKDALVWYQGVKSGGAAYYSNIYMLLLQPLLAKGRIERLNRGLYRVVRTDPKAVEEANEFDLYLQAKTKLPNGRE